MRTAAKLLWDKCSGRGSNPHAGCPTRDFKAKGRSVVRASSEGNAVDSRGDATPKTAEMRGVVPQVAPQWSGARGAALQDHWLRTLPAGEARLLEILIAAYPEPVDRETLSDASGYKKSSRDTYLQRLRARELIHTMPDGTVRAAALLFE